MRYLILSDIHSNWEALSAVIRHVRRKRFQRIIVLGDMLELGKHEKDYHRDVGSLLMGVKFDRLVLVGKLAKQIMKGAISAGADKRAMTHFADAGECARELQIELQPGDLVYVKGSRGIGLETIIRAFDEEGESD